MIGLVRGIVEEKKGGLVIIDVQGVGYEVTMTESNYLSMPPIGEEVTLYTHLIWKEDGVTLYGFTDIDARDMFRMLLQVSGVGPRMALNCLSLFDPVELLRILSTGDSKRLQRISGVGKKTAARLCVELKDKARKMFSGRDLGEGEGLDFVLSEAPEMDAPGGWKEAYSALLNLGYKPVEIRRVLKRVFQEFDYSEGNPPVGEIIRSSLKQLDRSR